MGLEMHIGVRNKKTKEVADLLWWCGRGSIMDEAWKDAGLSNDDQEYVKVTTDQHFSVSSYLQNKMEEIQKEIRQERNKLQVLKSAAPATDTNIENLVDAIDVLTDTIGDLEGDKEILQGDIDDWSVVGRMIDTTSLSESDEVQYEIVATYSY